MSRSGRRQHGYALLLTLVLLMIAAVALAHVARQSTGAALDAQAQTEALQRRWAVTSCRATLLPRAQGLLTDPTFRRRGEVQDAGGLRVSCELAGMDYGLVLSDEQTKYNPTVMRTLKLGDVELVNDTRLRSALFSLSGIEADARDTSASAVRLRPLSAFDAAGRPIDPDEQPAGEENPELYISYGQLFDRLSPEALVGGAQRPGVASRITCWGDGKINLRHASPSVISRVFSPVLGYEGVQQLLVARSKAPGVDPAKWLDAATSATEEQRALAGALVTERSNAQSLWVVAHSRTRSWYTLSVRVYTPPSVIEARREAEARTLSPSGLLELEQEPLPDPLQRYDFAW